MHVELVEGDLLDQAVDVIVNPWNRNIIPWWLLLPQGVSGAIKKRAGYQPFRELGRLGPIRLGGAVHSSAGRLPHKAIIHVAGINMLWRASERSIRDSVANAARLAEELGFHSIAFPLIGSGSGGLGKDKAERIMLETLAGIDTGVTAVLVRHKSRASDDPHPPIPNPSALVGGHPRSSAFSPEPGCRSVKGDLASNIITI